jgi:hypothetical protein
MGDEGKAVGCVPPTALLFAPPPGSARFAYFLDFRDCYYVRSGLLDRLNSDGFYWSNRWFHFPCGFLHWRRLGLCLGNRSGITADHIMPNSVAATVASLSMRSSRGCAAAAWDVFKVTATIPAEQVFRPLDQGGCPLVQKQN